MQAISETGLRKLLFPKKSGNSFAIAILFSLYFPSVLLAAQDNLFSSENKYQPYFEIGGAKYFNQNSTVAGIYDLFIPMLQKDDQLLFTDLRLFDRSGSSFEGNAHLGYRKLYSDTEQMFGIYGAFDRKRTTERNFFNQLTLGFEYWQSKFFIGGNIYKPIGATQKPLSTLQVKIEKMPLYFPDPTTGSRTQIIISQNVEKAIPGADLELGYAITDSLTGYVGGYYFAAQNVKTVAGPRARLTYDYMKPTGRLLGILDGISIEAGAQHDKPRHTSAYIGIKFKIGLTNTKRNSNIQGFARHMVELVRRDPDIVYQNTEIPHPLYVSIAKTPITSSDFIGNFGITEKTTLPELSAIINKLISYLSKDTIDNDFIYNYYHTLMHEIANKFNLDWQKLCSIFDILFNRQSTSAPPTNDKNILPNLISPVPPPKKNESVNNLLFALNSSYIKIDDVCSIFSIPTNSTSTTNEDSSKTMPIPIPPNATTTNIQQQKNLTDETTTNKQQKEAKKLSAKYDSLYGGHEHSKTLTAPISWHLDYDLRDSLRYLFSLDKESGTYLLATLVGKNTKLLPDLIASWYEAKNFTEFLDSFGWKSLYKEMGIIICTTGGNKFFRKKISGLFNWAATLKHIPEFLKKPSIQTFLKSTGWYEADLAFPGMGKAASMIFLKYMNKEKWTLADAGEYVSYVGGYYFVYNHAKAKHSNTLQNNNAIFTVALQVLVEEVALGVKIPFDYLYYYVSSDPKESVKAWNKAMEDTHLFVSSLTAGIPDFLYAFSDYRKYCNLPESDPKGKAEAYDSFQTNRDNFGYGFIAGVSFWGCFALLVKVLPMAFLF